MYSVKTDPTFPAYAFPLPLIRMTLRHWINASRNCRLLLHALRRFVTDLKYVELFNFIKGGPKPSFHWTYFRRQ